MTKVIVLGGAGFIGSHLCDLLIKKKFKVLVIDNLSTGRLINLSHLKKKIKFIKADISVPGEWQNSFKNVKYVFHLAALADIVPSIENPLKYFNANVSGTLNVIESVKKYKIKKIIYAASSSCYGIPKTYPTKETEKIDTRYPYALTKYMGENLLVNWSNIYKIKFISLRLFNVYGTRSRTSGTYGAMFGVFLTQKIYNKPFTVVGDGKQKRDFTYVTDVAMAFYKSAISNLKNEIFNVGSGKCVSVNKIIDLLKGSKVKIPNRPGEPKITHANIEKIKTKLKWEPKIEIREGVDKLLKEIQYWKKAPLWSPKNIKLATKSWFKYLK